MLALLLLFACCLVPAYAPCSFDRCNTHPDTGRSPRRYSEGPDQCWADNEGGRASGRHKCTCTDGNTAFLTGEIIRHSCKDDVMDCGYSAKYTCCTEDEVPTSAPSCDVGFSFVCKDMTRSNGTKGEDCRPDLDEAAEEQAKADLIFLYVAGPIVGVIAIACIATWIYQKKKAKSEDAGQAPTTFASEQGTQMAALVHATPAQPQAMQQLQVQLPHTWMPGQPLMVSGPGGGQMQVMPPPGSVAGQMIMVQMPAQPTATAVPGVRA